MLRGTIICFALSAALGVSAAARGEEPVAHSTRPTAATPIHPPAIVVTQSASCASDCQAQHDRCRVQTKGSPSCDAERQYCLEICLQKKKR